MGFVKFSIFLSHFIYLKKIKIKTYDIMASSVPTFSRVARIEFTNPVVYVPVSYLIPVPDQFVNILSYTKPFETWVNKIN